MKKAELQLPAAFFVLTKDEMVCTGGGTTIKNMWDFFEGTVTGLASAGADAFNAVRRGEMSPLSALCSGFVYLAGNLVASIIWRVGQGF